MTLKTAATVVALGSVAATLLPLVKSPNWWLRIWDFPRPQMAVLLTASAVGLGVSLDTLPDMVLLAAVVACLLYQGGRIFPYLPIAPCEGRAAPDGPGMLSLRLMVANIRQDNRQARRFVQTVGRVNPDLLLVIENDRWWDRQLEDLLSGFPYRVRCPQENTYGLSLYSQIPLSEAEIRRLVQSDVPSIFAVIQSPAGTEIQFVGVHPRPPKPARDTDVRDAEIIVVARFAAGCRLPVVVAGDLNDVAWSHTTRLFRRLSGLIDPRIGRGFFNTFHAKIPLIRFPIDHVFYDRSFLLRTLQRLPNAGSDHFPVMVEVAYRPEHAGSQAPPPPDEGDQEEGREILSNASARLSHSSSREPDRADSPARRYQ